MKDLITRSRYGGQCWRKANARIHLIASLWSSEDVLEYLSIGRYLSIVERARSWSVDEDKSKLGDASKDCIRNTGVPLELKILGALVCKL